MKSLKILLLSLILSAVTETVYAQLSTPVDTTCICYTDSQDARCIECMVNRPKIEANLSTCESLVHEKDIQIQAAAAIIEIQNREIQTVKRKARIWRSVAVICGGLAVIEGLVLIAV